VAGDRITAAGRALRSVVEETTDRLAERAFAELSDEDASDAYGQLAAVSAAVAGGGLIPFPNPIGLPSGPG